MYKSVSIKEYMKTDLATFKEEESIEKVISVFIDKKISGAPVVNMNGNLVGIISERDCMKLYLDGTYHEMPAGKVSDFMTSVTEHVHPDASVFDVAKKFYESKFRRFPVVKDDKLVGIITRHDLLHAIRDIILK